MDNGTIDQTYDGRVSVNFRVALDHAPARVWQVITDRKHLDTWFPAVVELDLRPGAELTFGPTPHQIQGLGVDAAHVTHGTMISVHPHHILEYIWDGDTLHWELAPNGTGGCWLTLTHTVEDQDAAHAHAGGWHAGLEVIAAQLNGRKVDWSPWERADELAPRYHAAA